LAQFFDMGGYVRASVSFLVLQNRLAWRAWGSDDDVRLSGQWLRHVEEQRSLKFPYIKASAKKNTQRNSMELDGDKLRDTIFAEHGISHVDVEPILLEIISKTMATDQDRLRTETIERVARFTKTNKKLVELGCEPLLFNCPPPTDILRRRLSRKIETCEIKETKNDLIPHYVFDASSSSTNSKHQNQCVMMNDDDLDSKRCTLWRDVEKWVSEYDMTEEEKKACEEFNITVYEYSAIHGDYGFLGALKLEQTAYVNLYDKLETSVLRKNSESHADQYFKRKIMLLSRRRLRYPELIPRMGVIYSSLVLLLKASKKANRRLVNNQRKKNKHGYEEDRDGLFSDEPQQECIDASYPVAKRKRIGLR